MISLWMPLALTTGSLIYKADSISVCNPVGRILGNVLIHEQKVQMKTLLNELRNSIILEKVALEFHITPVNTLCVVVDHMSSLVFYLDCFRTVFWY